MRNMTRAATTLVAAVGLSVTSAQAQFDLAGEWSPRYHEDEPERLPGPDLVEYHGIPLNEAGRLRGLSWSASLLTLPEHQCKPHPADYAHRAPGLMRIWNEYDSDSQQLVAIRTRLYYQAAERTIWMDGRPHPSEIAAHTWQGFSTGSWDGDTLTVTTTHLKQGWLRRNGLARSDKAHMTEHFIRHGNYLTQIVVIVDPVYLTEPFIRSNNWVPARGSFRTFVTLPWKSIVHSVPCLTICPVRIRFWRSTPTSTGCRWRAFSAVPKPCIRNSSNERTNMCVAR